MTTNGETTTGKPMSGKEIAECARQLAEHFLATGNRGVTAETLSMAVLFLRELADECDAKAAEVVQRRIELGDALAEIARLTRERDALFAYAECQAARDSYDSPRGIDKGDLFAVLSRHGFTGPPIEFTRYDCVQFIRMLRDSALSRATGEAKGE